MSEIIDPQQACEVAVQVAREAGKYITDHINTISFDEIETKGTHNFVTEVDKAAESMIIEMLAPVIPEAGFIAEEGTTEKKGALYNWIVDPLDGTTNFIHGAPPVSISIALIMGNHVVAGVVYEVWHDEMFYSWEGGAAFLNNRIIQVSKVESVKESLIATGFPYVNFDRMKLFMKSLEYFFTNTHGVRRLGSAAADLAYVACGRYDGFYEYNLNPWDVAAGAFIVKQAGGMVSDFKGGNNYIYGKEIVASNKDIFHAFLHDVGNFMNQT